MISGQGKKMGTLQELHQNNKSRYADNEEYAGAIKKDKLVLAIMRDNKTWSLAKILEIRAKPPPTSDDEEEGEKEQVKEVEKQD